MNVIDNPGHSRYELRLMDLPSHGRAVHLRVQVRRFPCGNASAQAKNRQEARAYARRVLALRMLVVENST